MQVETKSPTIYTTPGGWEVRELSHAQFNDYDSCPQIFKWKRLFGWSTKQAGIMELGKAVEEAVRSFYKERRDPVETFEIEWMARKEDQTLTYSKADSWEALNKAGRALMAKFANTWEDYPPRSPVFPNYKTDSRKVRDGSTGVAYQTIPDLIDTDARGPFIADLKCLGYLLDDLPGIVVLDSQLRTQAAATKIYRVAFWNFCRKPKQVDPPSLDEIMKACKETAPGVDFPVTAKMLALWVARETCGLNIDDAGKFIELENPQEANKEWKFLCKQIPELKVKAEKIAEDINKAHRPQYIIQWLEATMPEIHATEMLRHEMSIFTPISRGYFPRTGGIRYPNNICTDCSYRGLCMEELLGPNEAYTAITKSELVRVGEAALDGLE